MSPLSGIKVYVSFRRGVSATSPAADGHRLAKASLGEGAISRGRAVILINIL
jgi:hypothetical protein